MIRFLSICQNTFLQTIRQPIYGALVLVTFLVLVMDLPLAGWTMGTDYHVTDQKMLEALGLSTLLISGLFVASFSASSVLSREIEDRTALTVISKPVSRATFVLGKFGGVAAAVIVAFYLCSLVFLMTVRHKVMPAAADPYDLPVIVLGICAFVLTILTALVGNLLFDWTFTSAGVWSALLLLSLAMGLIGFIGKGWKIVEFGADIPPQVLVGMVLILMAVLVFVAVAVAVSTRLGQAMTLLICFGVLFVGSMHPYIFGYLGQKVVVIWLLGGAAPNLTYFYPLDALANDTPITADVVGLALGYCILYVAGVLAVGMALFHRRELESQGSSTSMPGLVSLMAGAGRIGAIVLGLVGVEILAALLAAPIRGIAAVVGRLVETGVGSPVGGEGWEAGASGPAAPTGPDFQPAVLDLFPGGGVGVPLLVAGLLVLLAVAAWLMWGYFSRGVKWSWYLVLVAATIQLLCGAAVLFLPRQTQFLHIGQGPAIAAGTAGAAMLVILLLPKTRHHFTATL